MESDRTLSHDTHAADGDAHDVKHTHVTSPMLLLTVYGILVTLTILTVAVTMVDFGDLNVWVALLIAVIKAGFVAMYFMHLRWDAPFNGAIVILSLLFIAFFIGITVLDTHNYQGNYAPPAPGVTP